MNFLLGQVYTARLCFVHVCARGDTVANAAITLTVGICMKRTNNNQYSNDKMGQNEQLQGAGHDLKNTKMRLQLYSV